MGVERGIFSHDRREYFTLAKGYWDEEMDFTDYSEVRPVLGSMTFGPGVADRMAEAIVAFARGGYEYAEDSDYTKRFYEWTRAYREVGCLYTGRAEG